MRRLIIAALAAAAVTAATAPLGSAGSVATAQGFGCDWSAGAGTFSTVAQLSRSLEGRARDPVQLTAGAGNDAAADKAKAGGGPVTIPVYFHVIIGAGNVGNLTNAEIAEQITVLNLAYSGFYGGVATPFRFRLDGIDRTVNPAWFAMEPESPEELAAKTALRRGGLGTLNIYSTNGANDALLGWAYLPKDAKRVPVIDGTIVHWGSLPGGPIQGFNLGHTATHEVGHWLGLYHVFDFGCQRNGDFVQDTPAEAEPSFGCDIGKDTCKDPGSDPIHNFMDYSDDPCYREFTAGQSKRMEQRFRHYRS
jgi:hypothetical protein